MNPRLPSLLVPCLVLALLCACEDPSLKKAPEVKIEPAPSAPVVAPQPATTPVPVPPAPAPETATAPAAEENLPEAEPELSVTIQGKQLLLSGALKSRLQVERINETLKREFPDLELKSDLKVESHRIPVGWGNRVDQFIVPYLQRVGNGRLAYKDTIVTLEGTVKSEGEIRMISESAIETFSGSTTTDIDNQLKVEEPKP